MNDYGQSGNPVVGAIGSAIMLAFAVLMLISLWKVFQKAGKPGWASIIPIYNTVVQVEIAERPLWWFLLLFVPLVNVVIAFVLINDISLRFGKGIGYTLGLIFLPFIFWPMLGFGADQYQALGQPA